MGQRVRHIAGVEAAREEPRLFGFDHAKQAPVEAGPAASWPPAAERRLGVEQQEIGHTIENRDQREIGLLRGSNRLHHGKAETGTNGGDPFRGFASVQLKEPGIERFDRRREQSIVGIDRQQDLARPARGPPAEICGQLQGRHAAELRQKRQSRPCRRRRQAPR